MTYALVLGSILATHVLAILSPGPNLLVVAQTAISRTRGAGIVAALGIATGAAIWSSAALLGLTVLLTHFAWLARGLRMLGGIYLLYLGIRLWRAADRPLVVSRAPAPSGPNWHAYALGLLTNLTNPKALIFYGGVFAAFLTPDLPAWVNAAAIGIIVVNSIAWHVGFAWLFSTRRARAIYDRIKRWIDRGAGTVLALLGLHLLIPQSLPPLTFR